MTQFDLCILMDLDYGCIPKFDHVCTHKRTVVYDTSIVVDLRIHQTELCTQSAPVVCTHTESGGVYTRGARIVLCVHIYAYVYTTYTC